MGYSPWGRKESDATDRLHFTSPSLAGSPPAREVGWDQDPSPLEMKCWGPKKFRTGLSEELRMQPPSKICALRLSAEAWS